MNKYQTDRVVKLRLQIIQYAIKHNNINLTCRHFGISRTSFYKWYRRYERDGINGLYDRSRKPTVSPRSTSQDVISKILYIRQHYHFGAQRITYYLERFHKVKIASSTVHKILTQHGLNRLPQSQKKYDRKRNWKRYEKQKPGHALQVDVKFVNRVPGSKKKFYQYTAIDDCTRIRVLKIYDSHNQATAIKFIDEVLKRLPFRVYSIQTDNGAEFQSKFRWHLENLDINHIYIKPRTPRLNGKVERSHKIDNQEFYQLLPSNDESLSDMSIYNQKLREWEDYYNFQRPHGSLDGQTPYERLKVKQKSHDL